MRTSGRNVEAKVGTAPQVAFSKWWVIKVAGCKGSD